MLALTLSTASALPSENTLMTLISSGIAVSGASECYAPANADPVILNAADEIIGHHDEDGVARFLRKRFEL